MAIRVEPGVHWFGIYTAFAEERLYEHHMET